MVEALERALKILIELLALGGLVAARERARQFFYAAVYALKEATPAWLLVDVVRGNKTGSYSKYEQH